MTGNGDLLQAIGLHPRVSIAARRLSLRRDDILLLCCAELARATSTEWMLDALGRENSPEAIVRLTLSSATTLP